MVCFPCGEAKGSQNITGRWSRLTTSLFTRRFSCPQGVCLCAPRVTSLNSLLLCWSSNDRPDSWRTPWFEPPLAEASALNASCVRMRPGPVSTSWVTTKRTARWMRIHRQPTLGICGAQAPLRPDQYVPSQPEHHTRLTRGSESDEAAVLETMGFRHNQNNTPD